MRENELTSMAPDWTPAPSNSARVSHWTRTGGGAANRGVRTLPAGSPSVHWFENALAGLQGRSIENFSTLLLVWHLIALSICCVAYDLLD